MNIMGIEKDNVINGPGLRVVLWVAGCSNKCEGCHNPETWDPTAGHSFLEIDKKEIFSLLEKEYCSGITFSGGDPFFPGNREEIKKFAEEIKEKFPNKTIWAYTGFSFENIKNEEALNFIDILIDGRFVKTLKDGTAKWRGSSNQRIIKVKESLQKNETVLYDPKIEEA
jgi:anaerobic ribonucleoside-triphosphate reductase activating protein